jgi:aryl-alcohol dehydrogenase-like predicted oxidoreductase
VADTLKLIAARYRCSAAEIAIAWTLRHPAVTAAIVGARRPDQVDGFIGAPELELSAEDVAAIEEAVGTTV